MNGTSLYESFRWRYRPATLIESGAKPEQISDPFFSFLSSKAAFQRIVHLFDGHVHYAHANWENTEIYRQAAALSKKPNPTIAISTTNISDVEGRDVFAESDRLFRNFVAATSQTLINAGAATPIVYFQTRETKLPHHFQRFEINNSDDAKAIKDYVSVETPRPNLHSLFNPNVTLLYSIPRPAKPNF